VGPRGKVKGSWWRHWTLRKAIAVAGCAAAGFVLLGIAVVAIGYESTPIPTQELLANTYQNSTVYYSDGKTVMGTFGDYDRQILSYNQIPKIVQDAAVSAEDRSFWTEGGVAPKGILRAAYEDVFSSSDSLQGGSTITQQFVRNYYDGIGTAQTASRKIKEIFVSVKIAKEKSKPWILTNYLNTIYLGDGAYGVSAASELYFGVPVSKLTVAQAAVIAAVIQQPTNYPLPQFRSQLEARWHYVLSGMVKDGDLTASQAASLKFPAMNTSGAVQSASDPWDAYVMQQVKNELEDNYKLTEQQIDDDGLKIVTSVNYQDEKQLYSAVNQNVELMKEEGGALPSYALIGAELQNPSNGAILAEYPGRGEDMSTSQCDEYDCDLNTAAYSREQVGSSFKPYVLAEAVREGMNVQTSTLDGGTSITTYIPPVTEESTLSTSNKNDAQFNWYPVHNDGSAVYGAMSVQNAFALSSNTAFTDLYHRTGGTGVVNLAAEMGVNIEPPSEDGSNLINTAGEVGTALGIDSLTVNEQDQMLSTIDNGGTFHTAHVVQSVTAFGNTTYAKLTTSQVLTQAQDSQVQYSMETVTTNGTAIAASFDDGRPIIAKTGTTTSYLSAFFLGAIPQASLTVGIFTNEQGDQICNAQGTDCKANTETLADLGGSSGQTGFGGYWPARIWHSFMQNVYGNTQVEDFLSPQFSGSAWDQMPKAKSTKKATTHNGNGNGHNHGNPITEPSEPTTTASSTATASPTATATASPTATATCIDGFGDCNGGGGGGNGTTSNTTAAGAAVGGGLLAVLPGSLLWNKLARRRKKRTRSAGTSDS
jgi:membrane peptidoglycan carboxypeptidase